MRSGACERQSSAAAYASRLNPDEELLELSAFISCRSWLTELNEEVLPELVP